MLRLTACASLSFALLYAPALAKEERPPQDSASSVQSDQGAEPQTIDYTRPFRFDGVFQEFDLETVRERSRRQLESANPQPIPEIVEPQDPAPKSE